MKNGTHKPKPIRAILGESGTGKEEVGVEFEIDAGDGPPERIWWYGFFTEAATPWTLKALRTCGWLGSDLSDLSTINPDNGADIEIVVEEEEYEGKVRQKVKYINGGAGVGMKKPLDSAEAKAFAAKMKGAILALEGGSKPAPKPAAKKKAAATDGPPPGHPAAVGDDEIPF